MLNNQPEGLHRTTPDWLDQVPPIAKIPLTAAPRKIWASVSSLQWWLWVVRPQPSYGIVALVRASFTPPKA